MITTAVVKYLSPAVFNILLLTFSTIAYAQPPQPAPAAEESANIESQAEQSWERSHLTP